AERARASAESSGRMGAEARALEECGREIGRTLARLTAAAEHLRAPARAGVAVIERRSGELAAELQACAHDEAGVQTTARSVAARAAARRAPPRGRRGRRRGRARRTHHHRAEPGGRGGGSVPAVTRTVCPGGGGGGGGGDGGGGGGRGAEEDGDGTGEGEEDG